MPVPPFPVFSVVEESVDKSPFRGKWKIHNRALFNIPSSILFRKSLWISGALFMSSILRDEATNIITSLGCKIFSFFRSHVMPKSCHVPKLDLVHCVLKVFIEIQWVRAYLKIPVSWHFVKLFIIFCQDNASPTVKVSFAY